MFLDNFSDRLKEERVKLDLSQSEFGELCGVKKLAQFHYEKGDRFPDANYLMQALRIGVDVNYLLTGQHTISVLSKEEAQMINMYREASVQAKKDILGILFSTDKVAATVVHNQNSTVSGQQNGNNNKQTNEFNSGSSADQNTKGGVKIKSKGRRSQAGFNISNNEK
jgi:transcriptional regulator with XRE-family HTH domain